jgi:deazaflavin-dependent oxidoreductase (nitroreductase family)
MTEHDASREGTGGRRGQRGNRRCCRASVGSGGDGQSHKPHRALGALMIVAPIVAARIPLMPDEHYQRPGWFTTNVFNRLVAALTRGGVSVYGSRLLEVRGRKSGEWRQTPVNLLRHDGAEYLVSPRGHTQWVKNLRVSAEVRLRVGRRTQQFTATELTDDEKPPLLRAYLKKWKFEVGAFFGGVRPDAPDDELRRIAPDHPVFRLTLR